MLKRKHVSAIIFLLILLFIGGIVVYNLLRTKQFVYDYSHLLQQKEQEERVAFLGGPDSPVEGMVIAQETDELMLCINMENIEIAVLDKRSGQIWYSNPPDKDAISPKEKSEMSSQFLLTYINANLKKVTSNSYDKFVNEDHFEDLIIERIKDGIRIEYIIGNFALGAGLIPEYITPERLEEAVLSKISADDAKFVLRQFAVTNAKPGFLMQTLPFKRAKTYVARVLNLFIEAGYTEEDLEADNLAADYEMDLSKDWFRIPLEYRLTGDTLTVSVCFSELEEANGAMLMNMEFMKYFGAGSAEEEGYMIIPAGCGALINFNNNRLRADMYSSPVYGPDPFDTTHTQLMYDTRLPVYGIKKAGGAFVCSMEAGEAFASLNAQINGMYTKYNIVYPSFNLRAAGVMFVMTYNGGRNTADRTNVVHYEENAFGEDFVFAYMFLPGDADYGDMAARYQKRLIETGRLKKSAGASTADTPFFMDVVGAVEKEVAFMGVPYTAPVLLTKYEQAGSFVDDFNAAGISNIQMRYVGWFNGGINHHIARKMRLNKVIGNGNDLQALQDKVEAAGGNVYFDTAMLETFVRSKNFNRRSESARLTPGWMGFSDIIANMNRVTFHYRDQLYYACFKMVTNPNIVPEVTGKFIKNSTKYNMKNVSLRDLGNFLGADQYTQANVNRDISKRISMQSMQSMSDHFDNVMVRGGYMYSLAYADYLYDVPMYYDHYTIVDEEIPFYQMVVYGYIDYAGIEVNVSEVYDERDQLLRMIEYGASPRFAFTHEDTSVFTRTAFEWYLSTTYTQWRDQAIRMYNEYNNVHKYLRGATMVRHATLQPGVTRTDYSNGYFVYVNYNDEDVTVLGVTVKAKGYSMGGGVK